MASSEKTEKATQKKRADERKKGNVFQSRDVTSALGLLVITFALKLIVSPVLKYIQSIIINRLDTMSEMADLSFQLAMSVITDFVIELLLIIAPLCLGIGLIGIILGGIQTRFLFSFSKLKPKFSRINPVEGLKRIFSLKSLFELLKSLFKVIIICMVLYTQIMSRISEVLKVPLLDLDAEMSWFGAAVYDITMEISMYMALFAIADYLYQWWEYDKNLRMTKQEIKDEYKQTEGDPQIKSRIKDVQRKMAAMRMMKKVPHADVVIKNPTHFAVALEYNPSKNKTPVVIAKGKDYLALRIIEIAEQNGVEITENRPLARGLYESVEIGRAIPPEFYRPVAEVLAFIYKLKKQKGSKNEKVI